MAKIEERFAQKFATSRDWHQRGRTLFPGGVSGQGKFGSSFPLCFEHAQGPYKHDVDGNQLIDYSMGSGSLIMGHSPPEVTAAIIAQADKGSIVGGSPLSGHTSHQIRYAEAIKRLMPSMERLTFTTSGTASTYLAMRLARAHTGKTKIVKFHEHFHGWHDYVTPESGQTLGGVPQAILDGVIVAPVDTGAVARILSEDNDIAAVIVEAHGAHYGTFPLPNPQFLQDLREITARHGVVFILDEVVTGFRLSPGGAQVLWDIEPDLTTLSKVMGGGQPGAAVGGKAEIMDLMALRGDPGWDSVHRVAASGTFDALALTAAAGIATLEAIATKGVNAMADAMAQRLKDGLNEAYIKNEVPGHARGLASVVQVNLGADCDCDRELCTMSYEDIYRTATPFENTRLFRQAMAVNGVDLMGGMGGPCFMVSSSHDEGVIDRTIDAFSQSMKDLRAEGGL